MTKDETLERQVRIMKFSMTPVIIAIFVIGLYFLYLKTIGIEISTRLFFTFVILVTFLSTVACLTLNEALLKILYDERFNFKRLAFRWMLPTMYCSLVWIASVLMSLTIPFVETFFQLFFGTLLATAIFVIIILRFRHLFGTLDKGEW
jgi:hypothetical protein